MRSARWYWRGSVFFVQRIASPRRTIWSGNWSAPQLAWIGLPLQDRHRTPQGAEDFAQDPAASAIEHHRLQAVIEWIEQGPSIV